MPTTHEQPDFAHAKSFVLCSFLPTKSACSAAAEKCLSGVGQPLSSVSGRKRYNTLDFASKIVCQQGCFSPLLETQSQGAAPLWTPRIFSSKMVPKLKKCSLTPFLRKHKTAVISLLAWMKIATVLLYAISRKPILSYGIFHRFYIFTHILRCILSVFVKQLNNR